MSTDDQLLLDLGGAPSLTRDDIVVSPANLEAVSIVDNWPDWPSPWVLMIGPPGCGKTHLATIWKDKAGAQSIDGQPTSRQSQFIQDGVPVVMDNVNLENIGQAGLFHIMNGVRQAGSSLLMTSETAPDQWAIQTPDLLSRLRAATTIVIQAPDDALFQAVITKLFADRQVAIDPGVVDYVSQRVERSLAVANEVVRLADELALARKTRITKQLMRSIVDDLEDGQSALKL